MEDSGVFSSSGSPIGKGDGLTRGKGKLILMEEGVDTVRTLPEQVYNATLPSLQDEVAQCILHSPCFTYIQSYTSTVTRTR